MNALVAKLSVILVVAATLLLVSSVGSRLPDAHPQSAHPQSYRAQSPRPQDPRPQDPTPSSVPDASQELRAIRRILLTGGTAEARQVAPRVRALHRLELDRATRESLVRVTRQVALRLGDLEWLASLRDFPDTVRTELGYAVMLARSQVEHAHLEAARATLDRIGDVDRVNEREKRRVHALRARVAQLEGRPEQERQNVEELIGHLYMWPRQRCQQCHATSKAPDVVTSLAISGLWFGDRYVELMRQQGDAEQVRADAEAELEADPDDDDARIRMAFALRALGREPEALQRFAELPWAAMPGRSFQKPRQMASYP